MHLLSTKTTMASNLYRNATILCLGLLLHAQVAALKCSHLMLEVQGFNRESLELLKGKTTECPEHSGFHFPIEILEIHQPQLATKAIYEILNGFFGILSGDTLQTGWESTLKERFLNKLFSQNDRIRRCLMLSKVIPGRHKDKWMIKLKRYFQRIATFLREKGQSACAHENVKLEFRRSFIYVDMLTKRTGI